jgi:hypothetical protein
MGELFIHDKIIDPSILSTDSTLLKAKGPVWHKSSSMVEVVQRSGIDKDAMWRFSHTKRWIFGYKLHIISSTIGSIIVPLAADFTTANISDNQIKYIDSKHCLQLSEKYYSCLQILDMMIMNCMISKSMEFRLVCPVRKEM